MKESYREGIGADSGRLSGRLLEGRYRECLLDLAEPKTQACRAISMRENRETLLSSVGYARIGGRTGGAVSPSPLILLQHTRFQSFRLHAQVAGTVVWL